MSGYRNNNYKKRKRSSWGGTLKEAGNTAIKALRVANQVRSLLNVEFKAIDTVRLGQEVTSSGYEVDLSPIAKGDDAEDRDGDQVKLKRVVIRGGLFENITYHSVTRIMLVKSIKGSVAGPVASGMLASSATAAAPFSQKENEFRKFYKILWEKTVSAVSLNEKLHFKINKALDFVTIYDASTGTTASENGLWLVMISDQITGQAPTTTFSARCWFIDN